MTEMAEKVYDLSVKQVADELHVHPETIKRWARADRIPARKNISGRWKFCRADVDAVKL